MENNQFPNPFEAPVNPFLDKSQGSSTSPVPASSSSSASTPASSNKKSSVWPPMSLKTEDPNDGIDDREKALALREKEIAQRETEIQDRELAVKQRQNQNDKRNNWPPLCPMVHSDIQKDIPPLGQGLCRIGFLYFHLHVCALLLNWVCVFTDFSLSCLFISMIYILAGTWVAWNLQYRRLYGALMKQSDTSVFFFLFNFLFSVGFDIVMAIGVPKTCAVGLWNALAAFDDNKKSHGTLYMVSFAFWMTNTVIGLYISKATLTMWRTMGGSMQRVKSDASKQGAKVALASYS
eukprot:c7144_g1_i1.p1 GENE.c7144_g1_i1~~c7144_g1_i1.p1  ORF type:complete len:292 (+),score=75.68 c7144_g1_i1:108-983(+)